MKQLFLVATIFIFQALQSEIPTIALAPFGDSKTIGRTLNGGYERTATHLFAQELKKELESRGLCHVLITHSAQETLRPYEIASKVNQKHVAAVIFIGLYQAPIPQFDIFYRSTNKLITTNIGKSSALAITPADQAHATCIDESKHLCDAISCIFLNEKNKKVFRCTMPLCLPLSSLEGVEVPSALFEGGLPQFSEWPHFIDPLVEGVRAYLARIAS